ncbi:MAG: hypothetical protein HFJ60_02495 [Clostridia bacterium]|jgi:type IV secretory pathway VirB2 component (pilin)|nr:hypothetical protein [Clostridia bacterium]
MKKTVKILTVLLLAVILVSFASNVLAAGTPLNPGDLANKIDYGNTADTNNLMTQAGKIMGLIRNISVIAAVIIIMVLGVKYMLGSVEEKADYKKSFMPLIVGIILVVAATSIASFIFGIVG